jgi:hypothetical protein
MTSPLPLPTGGVVKVTAPGPPTIKLSPPAVGNVLVMPTPGIPGTLDPTQFGDIVDDVLTELEPNVNLVVLYQNIRSQG